MKRIAAKLVIFLLLIPGGAVVNVGVAWGCALWIDTIRIASGVDSGSPPEYKAVTVEFDRGRMEIAHYEFAGYSSYRTQAVSISFGATGLKLSEAIRRAGLPHWGNPSPSPLTIHQIPDVHELYGWPLCSLACESDYSGETSWSVKLAETRTTRGGYWTVPKMLPLRPTFPGFLINTVCYAAVLWLLFVGPFATRRLIRKRRGRCVKCGYDLRHAVHDVCPECGK